MINCEKRQKEVKKARDGTRIEQYRCMEKKVPDTYLQIVDVPTCEQCPILAAKNAPRTCGERHWSEELLHVGVISRDAPLNVHPAEADLGYHTSCPYRWDGVCRVTGREINPEICLACDQETATEMANLGLLEKAASWANAVRRWVREGRPVRTDEEVAVILKICQGDPESPDPKKQEACNLYDKDAHACRKCGCAVSTDKAPLGNKLRMKTEICPMGLWK